MAENDKVTAMAIPNERPAASSASVPAKQMAVRTERAKMPSVARPPMAAPPAIDATFIWGVVRKGWYWILPLGVLITVLSAAAILVMHEPTYEARFRLEIDDDSFVVFEDNARNQTRDFIDLQRALMLSNNTLEKALSDPKVAKLSRLEGAKDPVELLREEIKVTGTAGYRLIDVTFADKDPQAAALVVNTVVDEFMQFRRAVDQTRTFDDERNVRAALAKAETEVEAAKRRVREMSMAAVQNDNTVVIEKETGNIDASYLNNLRTERSQLMSEIAVKTIALEEEISQANEPDESEKTLVETRIEITDDVLDADPLVSSVMSQLRQSESRIESLRSNGTVGENNPAMLRLKQERDFLKSELQAVREQRRTSLEAIAQSPQTGSVQGDLQAADEELSDLRLRMEVVESQIRDYLTGLSSSTASSVDVQFAEADLEEWNAIRSLVQERLIRLQTEREANDQIRELERATPPKVPVEELPYKLLALAAAAGMGFPMLLGLLLDLRSRRVDDAAQLEARSKLPVLAEIAAIPVRKQGKGAGDYRELKLFGESVDALSTSLILAQDLAQCRVFAITSALSGEGKTSVSCQLAVSISRSTGKRVLIIDGDLRSPDVHHVFNRPMTRGLAAVLAGEVDWHEVVDSGWSDHVHLLSAGRLKGSPHRLLTSGVFDDLIAQIRTEYEYIIIDTPPVLPASEALIFAKAADACLVSALRDRSRIDQLIQTYHRLQAAGANVAGSVLSGVPVREYAKYYGEYYHQST